MPHVPKLRSSIPKNPGYATTLTIPFTALLIVKTVYFFRLQDVFKSLLVLFFITTYTHKRAESIKKTERSFPIHYDEFIVRSLLFLHLRCLQVVLYVFIACWLTQ